MSNTVVMIVLLGLLLIALTAPFSALALLMIFLLLSAIFWTLWSMARTLILGDPSKKAD